MYRSNDSPASSRRAVNDPFSDQSLPPSRTRTSPTYDRPLPPLTKSSSSKKWKWITATLIVLVLIGIAVGIAVWRVGVNNANSSNNSSALVNSGASNGVATSVTGTVVPAGTAATTRRTTTTTTASNIAATASAANLVYIPGTAGVVKSNPADPSQFQKDPRLVKSFYGLSYTSLGVQVVPGCSATQANVTEDIQLMSQLTSRIHLYGADCNQTSLVLQAIQDTKVDMQVWLGVYIGDNQTVNNIQMTETIASLKIYGVSHVSGVTIGNEYILNAANPTTAILFIIAQIKAFRALAVAAGFNLQIGTADAGSIVTPVLAAGTDFILANVHPFFGGLPIDQAAAWTWSFYEENDVAIAAGTKSIPYIGETGWPSASLSVAGCTDGGSVCGLPNLSTFLATFPCQANTNGTKYFYFEAFDQPWQGIYGGIEPYWGLWDANKVLKDITLPTCISP